MEKSNKAKDDIYNSPLFVTIVGFILTGLIGGFLTSFWHRKEFVFKAKLEYEYSRIKAHSEAWTGLYNKIFDQTSNLIIAGNRVISMYEHTIRDYEQQKAIIGHFNSITNTWFKEAIVIRSQLPILFFKEEDPSIIKLLDEEWAGLVDDSKRLYENIGDLAKYNVTDKSSLLTQKYTSCKEICREFEEKVLGFGNRLNSKIFKF